MAPTLGDRIRKARHDSDLSQSELARRIGCNPLTIYRWEHDIAIPRGAHRNLLKQILSVRVDASQDEQEDPKGVVTSTGPATTLIFQDNTEHGGNPGP